MAVAQVQPEILAYLNHVAERFHLRPDISFSMRVDAAVFDEMTRLWRVRTDDGAVLSAQISDYCDGLPVRIIGTGSSGVQAISAVI